MRICRDIYVPHKPPIHRPNSHLIGAFFSPGKDKATEQERRLWEYTTFFTPNQFTKKKRRVKHRAVPKTLSTDERWSRQDIEMLDSLSTAIENLFAKDNSTRCTKCPANRSWMTPERGCCACCASNNGYLHNSADSYEEGERQLAEIKQTFGFSKKEGFFDAAYNRCSLPRARRSQTCLGFTCNSKLQPISSYIAKAIALLKKRYKVLY